MKIKIIIFFLLIINFSFSQQKNIINNESTTFQLISKDENIDFIVFDTKLETKKPIFLWCQGSLPYPLYVNSKEGIWLIGGGITNFDIENITKNYYLVIISMPKRYMAAFFRQVKIGVLTLTLEKKQ